MFKKHKQTLSIFLISVIIWPFAVYSADAPVVADAQQTQKQIEKDQLQQQLKQIEDEIASYQDQLSGIRSEKDTLANKVKQLKYEQSALQLRIQASNIHIENVQDEMEQAESDIDSNTKKLGILKAQISDLVVQMYEQERASAVEIFLTSDDWSDFYSELYNLEKINQSFADLMTQLKNTNTLLADKQIVLAEDEEKQKSLIQITGLQNQQLSSVLTEQNDLLKNTKGLESDYQAILKETQKKASQIRNRIYELTGGGSKQVTFGEAMLIAQDASALTGVRAAFLLAILTQESNLGKNVGTCNRPGDPAEKGWRVIMKPTRDQQPFLDVTSELGLDPDITPVSCPMKDSKGKQVGWGGAMGPAQFIPSTWVGYKDKVAAITGKPANPWDIRDAFIAAGVKLKADGAGTQSGEWAAAMRYFSGSTNPQFRFYGDNVVSLAKGYQEDIDNLSK